MINDTAQGIHVIGLGNQGFRHLTARGDSQRRRRQGPESSRSGHRHRGHDVPGLWRATVHMPFGSVYTSLQTGVVEFAENAVNVYLINKAL